MYILVKFLCNLIYKIIILIYIAFSRLKEPCTDCVAPYGFLNHMPLTNTTGDFVKLVRNAQVSGNLDAPEGGFDAIMQAIVCKVI